MFFHLELEQEMILHPCYFDGLLNERLKQMLLEEVEGSCDGKHGYIVMVTSIHDVSEGMISSLTGCATYFVKYKAIVLRPFKGEVIEGVVSQITKIGLFIEIGPLSCFVSHHSMPIEMQFNANPPSFKTKDEKTCIYVEDKIRVKIVGTRADMNSIFAIGTIVEDYLGLIHSY